jgi:SET domain-containing protein
MATRSAPVEVRESAVHGRGVFARRAIPAGTVVDACPLLYLASGDTPVGGTLMDYVFDAGDGNDGSWLALGITSLINHHVQPNAAVELDGDQQWLTVRTIVDVGIDEELFIDYGPTYFSDRGYE